VHIVFDENAEKRIWLATNITEKPLNWTRKKRFFSVTLDIIQKKKKRKNRQIILSSHLKQLHVLEEATLNI
jgi:hypothetical protein